MIIQQLLAQARIGQRSRRSPCHTKSSDRTKIRDGQVANRPAYAAIGVTLDGRGSYGGSGP